MSSAVTQLANEPENRLEKTKKKRLTKDVWLAKALSLINEEGPSCLGLRYMTEKLGVTTGSFYWHFESLENFIVEIMNYWQQEYNVKATELSEVVGTSFTPRERLTALTAAILTNDSGRYDLGIRAWAATNEVVANYVEKVDKFRVTFVKDIFKAMGFEGVDLVIRVENYLNYVSFYQSINIDFSVESIDLEHKLPKLIDFLIGQEK
jgi:AcrR family transcriptional regulator